VSRLDPLTLVFLGLAAGVATSTGVALVRRWATRRRILDVPNERSSHTRPTPRGGGLAIVAVVLLGLAAGPIAGVVAVTAALGLCVAGAIVVAAVSWLEDLRGVPVGWRLAAHVAAAVLALIGVYSLSPGVPFAAGRMWSSMLVTSACLIWIVGLTNAYNFMDGIDGIAGSQAVVAGLGWVALAGRADRIETWLGLLLAASSLGFLVHNWRPAKIFMGDVGSAFLGFSFAVLAIIGAQHEPRLALAGILAVWPFVFDTSFTFLRRLHRGENVFQAHRSHLYQRLVLVGYSHRFVTCLYGALAVLGVLLALMWKQRIAAASWLVPSALASAMAGLWLFVGWAERHQRARNLASADGGMGSSAL
jgi:UDP-N-acetylmuramyl pentapeptide phosphotransferase/UDP-N-acetylglucosamine-1-phosphate transferase